MVTEGHPFATKSMLANKVADINRLLNHKFTNEELNEKLRKQGSLDNKMYVFRRMETERKLQQAKLSGDKEAIEMLEEQMKEFVAPKLAFGTTLIKPRSNKPTTQERLADLNLRNQKLNTENIRRVQLEERKASRKAAAVAAAARAANDPSRGGTPVTATGSPAGSNTPKSTTPSNRPMNGGVGGIRRRNNDDENIAALDLDIDIEI